MSMLSFGLQRTTWTFLSPHADLALAAV